MFFFNMGIYCRYGFCFSSTNATVVSHGFRSSCFTTVVVLIVNGEASVSSHLLFSDTIFLKGNDFHLISHYPFKCMRSNEGEVNDQVKAVLTLLQFDT
jgi:hypothetical protein